MSGGVSERVQGRAREGVGWRREHDGRGKPYPHHHDLNYGDRRIHAEERYKHEWRFLEDNRKNAMKDDEGWQMVQGRQRRNGVPRAAYQPPDIAKSNIKEMQDSEKITSFCISNFPKDTMAKDLLRVMGCYEKMVEVVIPSRRDRIGRRFGFARYIQVEDPKRFAIVLDNVFVGGKKLFVNLPRFERVMIQRHGGYTTMVTKNKQKEVVQPKTIWVKKVNDNRKDGAASLRKEDVEDVDGSTREIVFNASEEVVTKLGKALSSAVGCKRRKMGKSGRE